MALRNLAVSSVVLATSAAGDKESDRRLFRFDEDSLLVKFDKLVTNIKKEVKNIKKEKKKQNQCEVENAQQKVYKRNEKIFCKQYYRINNQSLQTCNPSRQPKCQLQKYVQTNAKSLTINMMQALGKAKEDDITQFQTKLQEWSEMNTEMGVYTDDTKESWKKEVAKMEQVMFDQAVKNKNHLVLQALKEHIEEVYYKPKDARERFKTLCFQARGASPSLFEQAKEKNLSDIMEVLYEMQFRLLQNGELRNFKELDLLANLIGKHAREGTKLPIVEFEKLLNDYTIEAERLSEFGSVTEVTNEADIVLLGFVMKMTHVKAFKLLVKHVKQLNGGNMVAFWTEKKVHNDFERNAEKVVSFEEFGKLLANNASFNARLSNLEKGKLKKINKFIANELSSELRV